MSASGKNAFATGLTQFGRTLAEHAVHEEARIRRCAADPNYPTKFERGSLLAHVEDDDYHHKQLLTVFAVLDHLRTVVLRHAIEDRP